MIRITWLMILASLVMSADGQSVNEGAIKILSAWRQLAYAEKYDEMAAIMKNGKVHSSKDEKELSIHDAMKKYRDVILNDSIIQVMSIKDNKTLFRYNSYAIWCVYENDKWLIDKLLIKPIE